MGVPGLEHRLPITGKSGMSMSHVQHTPAPRRNVLVPTRLRAMSDMTLSKITTSTPPRARYGLWRGGLGGAFDPDILAWYAARAGR